MYGLNALPLLALITLQTALVCSSPAPILQARDVEPSAIVTSNTTLGTVTPFYLGEEAAYRWMGRSRNSLTTAEFSERMKECRRQLIDGMSIETSMQSIYPGGKFICDLRNPNQYFSMSDLDKTRPWLTYQRILNTMGDLVRCADWYQTKMVYYNLFELWTPPERPSFKRVQGVWLQQEPGNNVNTNMSTPASA